MTNSEQTSEGEFPASNDEAEKEHPVEDFLKGVIVGAACSALGPLTVGNVAGGKMGIIIGGMISMTPLVVALSYSFKLHVALYKGLIPLENFSKFHTSLFGFAIGTMATALFWGPHTFDLSRPDQSRAGAAVWVEQEKNLRRRPQGVAHREITAEEWRAIKVAQQASVATK